MTRRERLMRTLRGEAVDRPAVSFYEINGLDEHPQDDDPYNIYSHPSWRPLIELAREKTDRIVMRGVAYASVSPDPLADLAEVTTEETGDSRRTTRRVRAGGKTLTTRTRRDRSVNTTWVEEPLLKGPEDIDTFLSVSNDRSDHGPFRIDPSPVLDAEEALGDAGIVMIDTPDPLCLAASLFEMGEYTVVALTEPTLFRRLLDHFAQTLLPKTEAVAAALPGRLWRIYGPEYAAEPYLPPRLFREYVCAYVEPMIRAVQRRGGFVRVHSHGNLKAILDDIAGMGADGIDPIEPPPQGDVDLADVRRRYGDRMVLFGNLEVSDIENVPTNRFRETVLRTLEAGTRGTGRGFVLMPTACPYGRVLSAQSMANYEAIIEAVEAFHHGR